MGSDDLTPTIQCRKNRQKGTCHVEIVLNDSEARETRYLQGEGELRFPVRRDALGNPIPGTPVPGRVTMDGIITLVDGTRRNAAGELMQFENHKANVLELTIAAAVRLQTAIRAHRADPATKGKPEQFQFIVTPADLFYRDEAWLHGSLSQPRPSGYARDKRYNTPIVGLDIDAEGEPIDIDDLYDAYIDAGGTVATTPAGFTPAVGGGDTE